MIRNVQIDRRLGRRRHMGDAQTPGLIDAGVSIAATLGTGIATAEGAIVAGSLAVPVIGAAIAVVTLAISALGIGAGCGNKCVIASNEVDKIEPLMAQNAQAAVAQAAANGGCLTADEANQSLSNFDQLWAAIVNTCSNPQLGDPGKRCISERQRGGQYDYFAAHRDPISALPVCAPDAALIPASLASTVAPLVNAAAASTGISPGYLVLGALGLGALLLLK